MDIDDETCADDMDARRKIIKQSLDVTANDVGKALRDAGLRFPVYLTVPNSGDALASYATPLDPSDTEWLQATEIVSQIISKKLGNIPLRNRHQECAMARATMSAADVTDD